MNEDKEEITSFFNFGNPSAPRRAVQPRSNSIATPPITSVATEVQRFDEVKPIEAKVESSPVYQSKPETFETPVHKTDYADRSGMTFEGKISNVPTRSEYPARVFDQFVKKDARLFENDLSLIGAWSNNIAFKKRKLGQNRSSENRITDNTIIRLIISEFCERYSLQVDPNSPNEAMTENELREKISAIMKGTYKN